MSEVITIEDFQKSVAEATNLTDDQRLDAAMKASMDQAWDLMDLIGAESGYDMTTLYFLWNNIAGLLLGDGGWTAAELIDDIQQAEKDAEVKV